MIISDNGRGPGGSSVAGRRRIYKNAEYGPLMAKGLPKYQRVDLWSVKFPHSDFRGATKSLVHSEELRPALDNRISDGGAKDSSGIPV